MRSLLAALPLCLVLGLGNPTRASERHAPAGVKFNGPETGIASTYNEPGRVAQQKHRRS